MESRRITILGGMILVALTVITGISVFAIMQRHTETVLSSSLELSLESRARLLRSNLESQANDVVIIAKRPNLIKQIKQFANDDNKQEIRASLHDSLNSFLSTEFTALAILDINGEEIARAGKFVVDADLEVPVQRRERTMLLWKDELLLGVQETLRDHGENIGFIRTQTRMSELTKIFFDVNSFGKTGEIAVCAPLAGDNMQCFPTRLHPEPFKNLPRVIKGSSIPMDYALSGKTGVLRAKDYRDEVVVAAYRPLSNTGLGMVLKTDASELFQSVRYQLRYVILATTALILFGVLMLRWLVTPLLKKVIKSEQLARNTSALLAEKETRSRAIFENVHDGIIVVNESGIIESTNPGVKSIFGYDASEVIGRDASMLLPEQSQISARDYLRRYSKTGQSSYIGVAREIVARHKDETLFHVDVRVTEMRLDDTNLFICTMRDITERKLSEEKIIHLATHDPLTDLPNRHFLLDRVCQAILHARRDQATKVALLFIDLDDFKQVNDNYGHDVGDALLVRVAKRICSVLRSEDTTSRQGGDEFIVVLPSIKHAKDAENVAKKLIETLSASYCIDGQQLNISASIGIALYPDDGVDTEILMKKSDTAMYAAKVAGRGAYRFYHSSMRTKSFTKQFS